MRRARRTARGCCAPAPARARRLRTGRARSRGTTREYFGGEITVAGAEVGAVAGEIGRQVRGEQRRRWIDAIPREHAGSAHDVGHRRSRAVHPAPAIRRQAQRSCAPLQRRASRTRGNGASTTPAAVPPAVRDRDCAGLRTFGIGHRTPRRSRRAPRVRHGRANSARASSRWRGGNTSTSGKRAAGSSSTDVSQSGTLQGIGLGLETLLADQSGRGASNSTGPTRACRNNAPPLAGHGNAPCVNGSSSVSSAGSPAAGIGQDPLGGRKWYWLPRTAPETA